MTGLMWCGHLGMYHVILMTFLCSSLFCSQLNVYAAVNGDWVDTVSDASTASTVRDSYQLRWRNSLDDGNINNLDDTLYSINKQHLLYAQHAAQKEQESNRSFHLQQSLQHLKGVYHDKTTQSHMIEKLNLQRTVMVLVMQAPKGSPQYNIYFRNFICFAKQYQYDVLVYILRPHKKPYAEFLESLDDMNQRLNGNEMEMSITLFPFPEELFWRFVCDKQSPMKYGKHHAPYTGDQPSFTHFGALPMLVPLYEVLYYHYNVIYFDLDVGLVLDPLPHLVLGDADFVMSIENRVCQERQYVQRVTSLDWDTVEPNTGIMHIRSNRYSLTMFQLWLQGIVDENVVNDQRIFMGIFKKKHNMTYTSNCLPLGTKGAIDHTQVSQRKGLATPLPYAVLGTKEEEGGGGGGLLSKGATYCFLSDILFQNGLVSLTCTRQRREWYVLSMYNGGLYVDNEDIKKRNGFISDTTVHKKNGNRNGAAKTITTSGGSSNSGGNTGTGSGSYYPAMIHVNFAGGKTDELQQRGLWLYQSNDPHAASTYDKAHISLQSTCKPYSALQSHYAHNYNYTVEVPTILQHQAQVYDEVNVNNTLLKLDGAQEVFVLWLEEGNIEDGGNISNSGTGVLHGFPDGETFIAYGYDFGAVRSIDASVFNRFSVGAPIESVAGPDSHAAKKAAIFKARNAAKRRSNELLFIPFSSPNIDY